MFGTPNTCCKLLHFLILFLQLLSSDTLPPLTLCLSCGMKTLLDAGRVLEGEHFKCLRNYTSNNGFTHIHRHTETPARPRADSDTKEVEVTLSVSKAINLCHLKLCVQMSANWRQHLAGNSCVCECICVLTWMTVSGQQQGAV